MPIRRAKLSARLVAITLLTSQRTDTHTRTCVLAVVQMLVSIQSHSVSLATPLCSRLCLFVTVVTKSQSNRWYNLGSKYAFAIYGVESRNLVLFRVAGSVMFYLSLSPVGYARAEIVDGVTNSRASGGKLSHSSRRL